MKFSVKPKNKRVTSTPFSDFMTNASSSEMKKVFTEVLKASAKDQKRIIEKAREIST